MKVFISWSGERSRHMAAELKEWLPMALQHVEPWMSEEDIEAGGRWATSIGAELQSSNIGIVCVTAENLTSDWLHFEAGALSKSLEESAVIPALLDIDVQAVSGPLAQFQAKKMDMDGVMDIAKAINRHGDNKLDETTLSNAVEGLWNTLNDKLQAIPDADKQTKRHRSQSGVLEDLVTNVRGVGQQVDHLEDMLRAGDGRKRRWHGRPILPMLLDGLTSKHLGLARGDTTILLILAGLAREDLPWISELLVDFHRNYRVAIKADRMELIQKYRSLIETMIRNPEMMKWHERPKYIHALARELYMGIDLWLDQLEASEFRSASEIEGVLSPQQE